MAKAKKTATNEAKHALYDALSFVAVAQEKNQLNYQTHCRISSVGIYATDGFITAFHPLAAPFPITIAPRTHEALRAIQQSPSAEITSQPGFIAIQSGRTKIKIPSLSPDAIPVILPDKPLCNIPATILAAMLDVAPLTDESAARVAFCSVLLRSYSAAATNGTALLEIWHGEVLPFESLIIPIAAIDSLKKTKQIPTQLGVSKNSLTFYFESGAWLKAQLYCDEYPDINRVLNVPTEQRQIDCDFIPAIKTASEFSSDGKVYLIGNHVTSSLKPNEGAEIRLENFTAKESIFFNSEDILLLAPRIKRLYIDFAACKLYFSDDTSRGVIVGGRA